jgi:hypothetical protein
MFVFLRLIETYKNRVLMFAILQILENNGSTTTLDTSSYVEKFATMGLRTLCVAYKFCDVVLQQILPYSMQLAWMAFPFPYADLKFPFCAFQSQKNIFFHIYAPYQLYNMCIRRLLHYIQHTSGLVLKIKNYVGFPCHVTRSMILDLPYTGNAPT